MLFIIIGSNIVFYINLKGNSIFMNSFINYIFIAFLIIYMIVVINGLRTNIRKLNLRLEKLAIKIGDMDCAVYGVSEADRKKISELMNHNKKLDAIKFLKSNYQMGLSEAKAYVEQVNN